MFRRNVCSGLVELLSSLKALLQLCCYSGRAPGRASSVSPDWDERLWDEYVGMSAGSLFSDERHSALGYGLVHDEVALSQARCNFREWNECVSWVYWRHIELSWQADQALYLQGIESLRSLNPKVRKHCFQRCGCVAACHVPVVQRPVSGCLWLSDTPCAVPCGVQEIDGSGFYLLDGDAGGVYQRCLGSASVDSYASVGVHYACAVGNS